MKMNSPHSAEETDIEITKYLDILLRRRWIVASVLAVTMLASALHVFTATPVFMAQSLLLIEKAREGGTRFSENAVVENTQDDYYQTQYILLKSDSLLQKVYDDLELHKFAQFSQPNGLQRLDRAIEVEPVRRSRLVNIKVESPDPVLAARVANAVGETFVKQNIENKLFISRDILQALSVDSNTPEGRRLQESLPAVVNNPLVQQLKTEFIQVQSKAANLSNRYTPKHPERLALESHMISLSAQIRAETTKVVAALKTDLSGQLKGNNVRVVDQAKTPESPAKPRKKRALALSLIAGLLLGVLLALLADSLDQTIRTQDDVEVKLSQPFLGLIPLLERPEGSKVYGTLLSEKSSLTSEAFRNLRTMTDFAHIGNGDRNFLVTSSLQEEGKTYVATNLAVSFAQLGEKVLVIDGDLRRPQIHKNFLVSSKFGISDFLASGKGVDELEKIVHAVDVPGLHILPCGTRPPNPSELLNTPRLSALLAWAKQHYDRIVVDCTPLFPIHDTLLWGRHIRTAAFVVRYGKARIPVINDALRRLSGSQVKIAGIAINAAKAGGLTYSGYGDYYRAYYHTYGEQAVKTPR